MPTIDESETTNVIITNAHDDIAAAYSDSIRPIAISVPSLNSTTCPNPQLLADAILYYFSKHSEVHYKALYESFCKNPIDWSSYE